MVWEERVKQLVKRFREQHERWEEELRSLTKEVVGIMNLLNEREAAVIYVPGHERRLQLTRDSIYFRAKEGEEFKLVKQFGGNNIDEEAVLAWMRKPMGELERQCIEFLLDLWHKKGEVDVVIVDFIRTFTIVE